jgi:3'-phosphoadenosine 5'-phosphosulfate sulfotransferase (PAPS reductase)/FAD synthetase
MTTNQTKPIHNVINMSGGKDSTALAIVALERNTPNLRFVFADTGHEHAQTYEYVEYLRGALGVEIEAVRADFTHAIERKRETVQTKWRTDGVSEDVIERALSVLHPSGNPFLDMCLAHGRWPSTVGRFCSKELKHKPIQALIDSMAEGAQAVVSWQGVRADESRARRDLPERDVEFGTWEPEPRGLLIYRPIIAWTVEDVFAAHRRAGIEPNPLYAQGMSRVGCMPCIHSRKAEVREIAARFPEEIERLEEWERLVGMASKTGAGGFFELSKGNGIRDVIEWSRTTRGGSQYDLLALTEEPTMCSSIYGLCE